MMPRVETELDAQGIGPISRRLQECGSMTALEVAEFTELRSTIRQRGTQRVWVFVATLVAWSAATIATAALAALPVATLLPLLLLAGGFEAVLQLHTGVERVGRYLQVFYDQDEAPRSWERAAMAYGQAYPGGSDPLFTLHFLLAAVLNFVPVLLAEPVRLEISVVGTVHLAVILRLIVARQASARQRGADLQRFEQLKRSADAARKD
jgi:hypothetical protein